MDLEYISDREIFNLIKEGKITFEQFREWIAIRQQDAIENL